jgi:hypothetical protein
VSIDFSVVIPAFRRPRELGEAIASVLRQALPVCSASVIRRRCLEHLRRFRSGHPPEGRCRFSTSRDAPVWRVFAAAQ